MDDTNRLLAESSDFRLTTAKQVLDWLTKTKDGPKTLFDALYSQEGQRLLNEYLERDTIHVLVKVHGDGWVEVMSDDRRVRAKIIDLPGIPGCQPDDLEVERLSEAQVSGVWAEVNRWPTNVRATELCRIMQPVQWHALENKMNFELAALRGLDNLEEL